MSVPQPASESEPAAAGPAKSRAGSAARVGRIVAGAAVLAGLAVISAQLLPLYIGNFRFQRFLEQMSSEPENLNRPDDLLRAMIVNRAAELGLPVRSGQVRLGRSPQELSIEVRYVAAVDLPLYTVDLHFRPRAGPR